MELMEIKELKFDEKGLIPAIVVDAVSKRVLTLAYMNRESYELTLKTGKATFFSRSRKSLWLKGETSGHFMLVKQIFLDCDQDTILVKAEPCGPACHTGSESCFFNEVELS